MDDFFSFIAPAKNTLTVANNIYKILDSNTYDKQDIEKYLYYKISKTN